MEIDSRIIALDLTSATSDQVVAEGKVVKLFAIVLESQTTPGDRLELRSAGASGVLLVDLPVDLGTSGRPSVIPLNPPVRFNSGIHGTRTGTWSHGKEIGLHVSQA